jgi:hypothetical protein
MNVTINAKELRAAPKAVERVRKGARFTVIYRSCPPFGLFRSTKRLTSFRHWKRTRCTANRWAVPLTG